jgi:hypothetical protein
MFNPGQDFLILPLARVFEEFGRRIARGEYDVSSPDYQGLCRTIAYRSLEQASDDIIAHRVGEITRTETE